MTFPTTTHILQLSSVSSLHPDRGKQPTRRLSPPSCSLFRGDGSPAAPCAPPPHQRGAPPPSDTSRDFCVPSLLIHPTEYATKSHRFGTSFCSSMPSSFQWLPPCAIYGLTSQTSKLFKTFYNLALNVYTLHTVLSQIMLGFYLASPLLCSCVPPPYRSLTCTPTSNHHSGA